ncbi:MAG: pseudouridine-5'-phosphate glycosidase [Alphaproteobacteria bacterium]|nr:pseudouridine-5'-phosphate glycosidase [Alphaproteobacteria bacterium]
MEGPLDVRRSVAEALAAGAPVVALESTVISHGLPAPLNQETALALEDIVRRHDAVPATVGIAGGRAVVGLDEDEIDALATASPGQVEKASRRNMASVLAGGGLGSTTVAATMAIARAAGIDLFATGGIGGVHRGDAGDVSADLIELGRTFVAVVCSGNKAILDVPRSYEMLETLGVPVVGFKTGELPAFYTATTGISLDQRVDGADGAARIIAAQAGLPGAGGIVFVNPPPTEVAIDADELEAMIAAALEQAMAEGVRGKEVTPYLLDRLAEASGGATVVANVALLKSNAETAARIAVAHAAVR